MKIFAAIVCFALAGVFNAGAEEDAPWWTSAETRKSLECTIKSSSNHVAFGSKIPVVLTLRNIGSADIELPHPFGGEINMEIRVYLWDMQAGQPALSSPLQSRWDSSEGKGSGRPVGWFKLSPNEQRDIPLFVEIPLTNSTGESTSSLSPGQYGLRCEIEYHMNDILAGTDMTTVTPNTTPQEIAEAKAQGRVLVYMGQLWTGKVQSNIINVTLTAGP